MKKLFLFILPLLLIPFPAAAATINAASCSYDDMLTAINSAQSGDTVLIPAGKCTWSNQLVITKGVYLIGAGQGNATIDVIQNNEIDVFDVVFVASRFT
jgi:hypothetical protein